MPGTHTPTQTWHATGTYVLTGEVMTESVIKEVGTFAMDNVARLVGTAAGATPQGIRRIATVADLAALKAIAAADRADQDYVALDTANGERLYKFDSTGAGTGDDYAIVIPNAGTGRWHLVGTAPKSTTLRKMVPALEWAIELNDTTIVRDSANGRVRQGGGSNQADVWIARFKDLNVGDVISSIEIAGDGDIGVPDVNIVGTFYRISGALAATTPTVTLLGTVTVVAGGGAQNITANGAPLPIIIGGNDVIVVSIACNTTGAGPQVYLYWVALNGTRTSITE